MKIYYQGKRLLINAIIVTILVIIACPIILSVNAFTLKYNEYNSQTDSSLNYEIKFSIIDIIKNNDLEICMTGEDGEFLEKLTGTNCIKVAPARELLFNEKKITIYSSQSQEIRKTINSEAGSLVTSLFMFMMLHVVGFCVADVICRALEIKKKENIFADIRRITEVLFIVGMVVIYFILDNCVKSYWESEIIGMTPTTYGEEKCTLYPTILFFVVLVILMSIIGPKNYDPKEKIVLDKSNGSYMFEILETSKYEFRLIDILKNNSPITEGDATNLVRNGGCAYNLSRESVEKIYKEFKMREARIYYMELDENEQ